MIKRDQVTRIAGVYVSTGRGLFVVLVRFAGRGHQGRQEGSQVAVLAAALLARSRVVAVHVDAVSFLWVRVERYRALHARHRLHQHNHSSTRTA